MHIGIAIKKLRQLAGLTQQNVADAMGKTKGLVSQIEKTGKVNYYTLVSIAKQLKTTPEKIEQYHQVLANPKQNLQTAPVQNNLPELEILRLENKHLKEQISLLRKTITILEARL
jgi:transcriptional regulator with XRE-family HTH domain